MSEHLLNSDMSGILKEFYFSIFIYVNAKLLGDKFIVLKIEKDFAKIRNVLTRLFRN